MKKFVLIYIVFFCFFAEKVFSEFPRKPVSDEKSSYWQFWFIFQYEKRGTEKEIIVRPFYSSYSDKSSNYKFKTVLFPVYYSEKTNYFSTWTLMYFLTGTKMIHPDTGVDKDFFSPFLFWGRGKVNRDYYWGLFPFFGTIKSKLAWAEISFFLFPLYASWRYKEYKAISFLWPLIAFGSSPNRRNIRVWPFYSAKEHIGKYAYYSILWPLFQWGWDKMDKKEPTSYAFIFPLFGVKKSQNGNMFSLGIFWLPLFGSFVGYGYDKRTDAFHFNLFFFLFQYGYNNDKDFRKLMIIPFYGYSRFASKEFTFITPFYYHLRTDTYHLLSNSYIVFPFFWLIKKNFRQLDRKDTYLKIWPFFRYHRDKDGNLSWNFLSLLPLKSETMERLWEPIWSFVEYERLANGEKRLSLFLRLYTQRWTKDEFHFYVPLFIDWSRHRGGDWIRWRILYGLLGYERIGPKRRLQLLWFLKI